MNQLKMRNQPEQLDSLFERAKQLGVPEEYIKQVKDGINTK